MAETKSLPEQFCIRARSELKSWQPLAAARSDSAVDALNLVLDVPEFLSMGQERAPFRAAVVGPGADSGSRALVAVDEKGGVAVVGCPDERNPGSYPRLVGDILAVSGRLWRRSYESLAKHCSAALGKPWEEYIRSRAGSDWPLEQFRTGVAKALTQGHFPVVVVMNDSGGEAQEAVNYLKSMNLKVRTVRFFLAETDGVQVVWPAGLEQEPEARTTANWEWPARSPEPERPAPARESRPVTRPAAEPVRSEPAPAARAPEPEPEEEPAENPWAHVGSKPGVMAGKRPSSGPDADQRQRKHRSGGSK